MLSKILSQTGIFLFKYEFEEQPVFRTPDNPLWLHYFWSVTMSGVNNFLVLVIHDTSFFLGGAHLVSEGKVVTIATCKTSALSPFLSCPIVFPIEQQLPPVFLFWVLNLSDVCLWFVSLIKLSYIQCLHHARHHCKPAFIDKLISFHSFLICTVCHCAQLSFFQIKPGLYLVFALLESIV